MKGIPLLANEKERPSGDNPFQTAQQRRPFVVLAVIIGRFWRRARVHDRHGRRGRHDDADHVRVVPVATRVADK